MTPDTFRTIRKQLRLTQPQLSRQVGVGERHIRMCEAGDRAISGPLAILMQRLSDEAGGCDG